MFHRVGQVLLIVAVLTFSGAHWWLLQSIAWTNMLATNLQAHSLCQAFEQTFDGKRPCKLCTAISKGKQTEKNTDVQVEWKKWEFIAVRLPVVFFPPEDFRLLNGPNFSVPELSHEPAVPPPRRLSV